MPVSDVIAESGSRTERRRARNRQALVEAARVLFGRHGFEATTVAAIAAEADLGFGTFYRYFADKEAALQAVLDEARREIDAAFEAAIAVPSPAAALTELTARFADAVERNRDVLALMWQLAVRKTRPGRRLVAEGDEAPLPVRLGSALARIIRRGIDAGDFDASADAGTVAGLLAGAHLYLLTPDVRQERAAVVRALQQMELRVLAYAGDAWGDDR
jgi:AcrR family transcriptional regulator